MPPLPHQRAYASRTTSVRRFDWVKCKSATKWDPTRTLKQGFDLWALSAWRGGSQSAPIGPTPQRQICETAQHLAAVYGWGPSSVLKDTGVNVKARTTSSNWRPFFGDWPLNSHRLISTGIASSPMKLARSTGWYRQVAN